MRILGILLCCLILGLSTVAFAEQPMTVFSKVVATKNMQGEIPEIDGLRYTNLQKSVNGILNSKVKDLLAQVGGSGTVSYEVKLNRPSLVGILLKATNGGRTAYQAVNLDMTTGNEFSIRDFVGEGNAVHEILGAYEGGYLLITVFIRVPAVVLLTVILFLIVNCFRCCAQAKQAVC